MKTRVSLKHFVSDCSKSLKRVERNGLTWETNKKIRKKIIFIKFLNF